MSMQEYSYLDYLAHFGIGGAHPGGLALTQSFLSREKLGAGLQILDAGCGTGQTAAYIATFYDCTVTALDRNPVMLEKARQRFLKEQAKVHVIQGDVLSLPFADATFDLLLSESVTVFTLIPEALSEYARVLKQKGILILVEMTAEKAIDNTEMEDFRQFYGIQHIPSEKEWLELISKAGFDRATILNGSSVASTLSKPSSAENNALNSADLYVDILPSDHVDPQLHSVGYMHQMYTLKYANALGYRVYRTQKN